MQHLNSERNRLQRQKQDADARIATLQPQLTQLEQLRQQQVALSPALLQAQAAVAQRQAELDAAQQQVADIEQEIRDAQEPDQQIPRRFGARRVLSPQSQGLKLKLAKAKADVNAAQARLQQAQAQLAAVQTETRRLDSLMAGIIGSGVESQMQSALTATEEAARRLAALDADLAELSRDPLDRPALEQLTARWSDQAGALDLHLFDLDAERQAMERTRTALVDESRMLQLDLAKAIQALNEAEADLAEAEANYNELQDELNNIPDGGAIP